MRLPRRRQSCERGLNVDRGFGAISLRTYDNAVVGGTIQSMFSGPEVFIVLAIVLVLFGGSQLPKLARSFGQAQGEFKKGLKDGAAPEETPSDKDAS